MKWVVKFVQKWNSNPATIRHKRVNSILSFYPGLLVFRIVRSPRRSLTHSTKHSSFFHSPFMVLMVAIFLLYSFFSYSSYSSFSTCIILYGFLVASFCMSRGSSITWKWTRKNEVYLIKLPQIHPYEAYFSRKIVRALSIFYVIKTYYAWTFYLLFFKQKINITWPYQSKTETVTKLPTTLKTIFQLRSYQLKRRKNHS